MRPRPVAQVLTDLFDETKLESSDAANGDARLRTPAFSVARCASRSRSGSRVAPPIRRSSRGWARSASSAISAYVEVHVAPARFDPRINGLRIAKDIQVVVHFDGDALVRTAPSTDPRFEDVYRSPLRTTRRA